MTAYVDSKAAREALSELGAGIQQAASLALKAAVKASEESVRGTSLYRDRTGATRASLTSAVSGLTGSVSSGKSTRFLEFGTRPHVIEARGGGMLRFVMSGQVMFRRRVQHPGTSPRPFMQVAQAIGWQAADYAGEFYADFAIHRYNA